MTAPHGSDPGDRPDAKGSNAERFDTAADGNRRHRKVDQWTLVAAPENDLPAALAGLIQPDQLMRAAEDLDRIMGDLCRWSQLCVAAVAKAGATPRQDASIIPPPRPWDDRLWFSGSHRAVHRNSPLLAQIDELVQRLQTMAETLLPACVATTPQRLGVGCPQFLAAVIDVNNALRRMLCETWTLLANIDPLTGIGNRNALLRHLQIERERHERNRQPCCVAVIDLDRFKAINDAAGHLAGDTILRSIASLLAASVRPYDVAFRYGGDEFIVCLPNTDLRLAWSVVERLRLKIAGWEVPLRNGEVVASTVSIGVAPLTSDRSVEDTLELADRALYAAKRLGRNRLCLHTS